MYKVTVCKWPTDLSISRKLVDTFQFEDKRSQLLCVYSQNFSTKYIIVPQPINHKML